MIRKYIELAGEPKEGVAALMEECATYDQSVVSIQFDHSLNYFPEMNSWFLYFEEGTLTGVISLFSPLSGIAEISGCVKPAARNKGKFNELLAACRKELMEYKIDTVLFAVSGDSKPGMAVIGGLNLKCDHVEYLMKYEVFKEIYNSSVTVRAAQIEDADDFIRINAALFHETEDESRNIVVSGLQSKDRKLYVATINNETVGICTLYYSGNKVIIYGLGISEEYQSMGYGFDLVNSILGMLKGGVYAPELEVDSLNMSAYNLYKKAGFKEYRPIGYYEMKFA